MCQVTVVYSFEPCACSFTWGWDFEAGRMVEVRIPCLRHLREARERR